MYGDLISAYRSDNVAGFNGIIREYNQYLARTIPEQLSRPRLEFFFNQAQPFLQAMVLYVIVLIFALFSWLKWPKTLGKDCRHSSRLRVPPAYGRAFGPHVFARTTSSYESI